jgi:formamidopyrimidine-DNA glycosylase
LPELPEVETTARGLRGLLVGRRVTAVGGVDWPRMLPNASEDRLAQVLVGTTVTAVDRRGKYLNIHLDNGALLTLHRKMSGNLIVQGSEDPMPKHTHLTVRFDNDRELRFVDPRKFGRVHLFESLPEALAFFDDRLGPEPLEDLTATRLKELLGRRRGRIKSLLLDQAFLAGVGNLYADEALWESRIHPLRPSDSLTGQEIARLAAAIGDVLTKAIERRGTSFSDYLDAEGNLGDNQNYLKAYGREGLPCERCGSPIRRIVIGARSSHYCIRCQPAKGSRGTRRKVVS